MGHVEGKQEVVPPIIADGDGDVAIYDSLASAEGFYCLYEDVDDVTFFDSTGRVLRSEPGRRYAVLLSATEERQPERLRTVLRDFLRSIGEPIGDLAPLEWLIERRLSREPPPASLLFVVLMSVTAVLVVVLIIALFVAAVVWAATH